MYLFIRTVYFATSVAVAPTVFAEYDDVILRRNERNESLWYER